MLSRDEVRSAEGAALLAQLQRDRHLAELAVVAGFPDDFSDAEILGALIAVRKKLRADPVWRGEAAEHGKDARAPDEARDVDRGPRDSPALAATR